MTPSESKSDGRTRDTSPRAELAEAQAEIVRLERELAEAREAVEGQNGRLDELEDERDAQKPIVEAATELANHRASDGGIALTSEHIARWERLVAAIEEGQKT
jgi:chromosome segregation ATPase